jgi:hypothetical protein
MVYNSKEQLFELSIRVFTDDLEKALTTASGASVHLSNAKKDDSLLEKYVRAHVAYMTPQRQPKPLNYVGHEEEADANWIYMEMPYTEPFQGGVMKQNILMDLFDDQVNMVNVTYQGQKKTFVFRRTTPVQDVSLN